MKLTDRIEYSAASLTDLIHIVVTGDTSQDAAGSSYKIPLSKVVDLVYNQPLIVNNLTDIQISGLTAQNGMIVYNTTTDKFQGFASGTTWVDLS